MGRIIRLVPWHVRLHVGSELLTDGNKADRLPLMNKARFGDLLQSARQRKGYSLRDLAERTGMNYSRLSRIEHGTRPAPGLTEIRRLADSLDIDMSELLVSTGTPREVMQHLLWSERLRAHGGKKQRATGLPEWSHLLEKNTFRVPVLRRAGALCTVELGKAELTVIDFGRAQHLTIVIPPEAVLVFREAPDASSCTVDNLLPVRIAKHRCLGQVINLVVAGDGYEINTLHTERSAARLGLTEGDAAVAAIQATAIQK
jgi:XRE family transcriptional regulator of biofilm formation